MSKSVLTPETMFSLHKVSHSLSIPILVLSAPLHVCPVVSESTLGMFSCAINTHFIL